MKWHTVIEVDIPGPLDVSPGSENPQAAWTSAAYQHLDRVGGISWWQGSVASERTGALLSTLEQRLRELHDQGPTPAELTGIKAWVTQDQPRRLETIKGMAIAFADTAATDMPKDDAATIAARLAAVTAADVQAQTPDPTAMKAVVVGDLHMLRASLQDLGWGPIEEHDKAGKFLRTLSR
jgi:predicted Zn-dependent peptidase